MLNEPAQLDLLKKLQEATTEDVDEERGSFKKGDRVTYNMFGGGLTNSDIIRTLGTNEHTMRANHNETIAEIVEAIGEKVARYGIMFEDGFLISDVAASELKSVKEAEEGELKVGDRVRDDEENTGTIQKAPIDPLDPDKVLVEYDDTGERVTVHISRLEKIPESKTNEAEEATDTMKPQEKPNIKAEDYHMEDYSEEDLNKPEAKVKSKSEKSGDAIRQVEDDELEIKPDKVVTPKKESKANEQVIREEKCPKCGSENFAEANEAGDYACADCGYDESVGESKLKEETEFTPSRAEMKKIGDEQLRTLHGRASKSQEYWEKDRTAPEKAELAKQAVKRYEEELVARGLITGVEIPNEKKESKYSFMKKQKPLWLCNECHKTFRNNKSVCTLCESKKVEKLLPVPNVLRDVDREIRTHKKDLIQKAKRKGLWEDFGQKEVDALKDKYRDHQYKRDGVWNAIDAFNDWAKNYTSVEEQYGPGFTKEVFKVTWKNTDTGKEESTKVMAFDKADAKKEAERSNREDVKAEGPITEEPRKEEAKVPFDQNKEGKVDEDWESMKDVPGAYHDEPRKEVKFSEMEETINNILQDKYPGMTEEDVLDAFVSVYGSLTDEERAKTKEYIKDVIEEYELEESKLHEDTKPYTVTWQNLDEPHGKFRFLDVNAHSEPHAEAKAIDTLKRDGIPEKFIEIKAVELKESKLQEGVRELVGEVPGIDKEEQEILLKAIEDGTISNEWPTDEEMVDALTKAGVESTIASDVEAEDFKVAYVKHFLLTKAIKAAKVASESKISEQEVEGVPEKGQTYSIHPTSRVNFPDGNYEVTDVSYRWTVKGDLAKHFQIAGDKRWWIAKFYGFRAVKESGVGEAKEVKPIRTIEIVRSQLDPEAYNIRVVELPEGSIEMLDSVSDEKEAIKRGKEFARQLNAKFLGVIDEKRVKEDKARRKIELEKLGVAQLKDLWLKKVSPVPMFGKTPPKEKDILINHILGVEFRKKWESKLKEQEDTDRQIDRGISLLSKYGDDVSKVMDYLISSPEKSPLSQEGWVEVERQIQSYVDSLEESKLKEQEEDVFTTVAKGIVDKGDADRLAKEKEGQVIQDEEDETKFAVLVRTEQ